MTATWGDIARQRIERVAATLPDDMPLKDRIAAIDAAYPFGARSHWPHRAWLKARRTYLARFGYVKRGLPRPTLLDRMERDPVTGRPVIR